MRNPHVLKYYFYLSCILSSSTLQGLLGQTEAGVQYGAEWASQNLQDVTVNASPFQDSATPDINSCNAEELSAIPFLTRQQVEDILLHRKTYGAFVDVYELQMVRSLPKETVRRLVRMVHCEEPIPNNEVPLDPSRSRGILSVRTRVPVSADTLSKYEGHRASVAIRFRYAIRQNLFLGLMLEKDAGEPFLWRGQHYQTRVQRLSGFDNTRMTIDWQRPISRIDRVIVGKYRLGLGQGLLEWQGFPLSKGASTMQIQKPPSPLQPVFSPSESQTFQGVAIACRPGSRASFTGFVSYSGQDAVMYTDSVSQPDQWFMCFSALDTDGYHRTDSEQKSRNAVKEGQTGGKISIENVKMTISCNLLHSWFSLPMIRPPALYRKYLFEGSQLTQVSIDYRGSWRQFAYFGEHARSSNGGMAHIAGLQASLHRQLDMSLQLRSFGRNYQTLSGSALSESSLPTNETGLYTGIEWRIGKGFTFNAYADSWQHPWPGYQRSAPAFGRDVLVRCLWRKKRWGEIYAQWKRETKFADEASGPTPSLQPEVTQRLRLHVQIVLAPGWQWRCRAEWSAFVGSQRQKGFLLFHDLILKPVAADWALTARLAWMDVDGFESRIYSYEHDVLFTSSIPFLQGQGTRFYMVARKKWGKLGQTEIRWSSDVRRLSATDAWDRKQAESTSHQLTLQYTLKL